MNRLPIGEGRKRARCHVALRPPSHARITSLADFFFRPASLGIPFEGYEHVDLLLTGHLCTLQSMRLEIVKRVYPVYNVSWVNNFTQDNETVTRIFLFPFRTLLPLLVPLEKSSKGTGDKIAHKTNNPADWEKKEKATKEKEAYLWTRNNNSN